MKVFHSVDEFLAAEGTDLGVSDWLVVDQERINTFADATGDHQWIHTDPERAASGPFGGTIAHGLLTLSLLPTFLDQLYAVEGVKLAVNCGFNRVHFSASVPVGSKIRARCVVGPVEKVPGGAQGQLTTTIEVEGATTPACVAESVVRYRAARSRPGSGV